MKILLSRWAVFFYIFIAITSPLGAALRNKKFPQYDPKTYRYKEEYLYVVKGMGFADKKEYVKAAELFQEAIHLNPGSIANYWQGLLHENAARIMVQRFYKEEVKNYKKIRVSRESILKKSRIKDQYDKALYSYETVLDSFPKLSDIHFQLGKAAFIYFNDLNLALKHLTQAVKLDSDQDYYKIALAHAQIDAKKFKKARNIALVILNSKIKNLRSLAYLILGKVEFELKDYKKSAVNLEMSLKQDSRTILSNYYLAKTYEQIQKYDESMNSHKKFLKITPKNLKELKFIQDSQEDLARLKKFEGGKQKK